MQAEQTRLAAPPGPAPTADDPPATTLMTPQVVTVDAAASLGAALGLMVSGRVRHLPVLDGRRCLGVVTETDLAQAVAVGAPTRIGPLARPVPLVPVRAPRSRIARALRAGGADAVLVTDRGRVVGIVTAGDLERARAGGRGAGR
jgi:CBS domain-containing protein